jgi:hypothetical protein
MRREHSDDAIEVIILFARTTFEILALFVSLLSGAKLPPGPGKKR